MVTKKARNRDDLLYSKDEEEPNEKIDKIMDEKRKENELKREKEREEQLKQQKEKEKKKEKEEQLKKQKEKERKKEEQLQQKKAVKRVSESDNNNTPRKKVKQKITKPFNELLNGVTIVISGIQNPDRADLRTKALAMGAKYKPDWNNNTCTHLM